MPLPRLTIGDALRSSGGPRSARWPGDCDPGQSVRSDNRVKLDEFRSQPIDDRLQLWLR